MLWYKVFFGEDTAVRDWFGMDEVAHAEAHGEDHAEAAPAAGAAESHGDTAAEAHGDTAAATEAAPGAASAPQGALLMLPFSADEQAAVNERLDQKKLETADHPPTTMINAAHLVPTWVKVAPFVAMLIGLGLAWLFYIRRPDLPGRLAAQQRPLYLFLLNKWYIDELYDWLFVRPAVWLGSFFWRRGDGDVIDGSLNGVALGIVPFFTRLAGRAQSGYLFHYAFAMVLGIVALVTWMTLMGGAE
jgi:NADH-quinone oxidoreductase subunit L